MLKYTSLLLLFIICLLSACSSPQPGAGIKTEQPHQENKLDKRWIAIPNKENLSLYFDSKTIVSCSSLIECSEAGNMIPNKNIYKFWLKLGDKSPVLVSMACRGRFYTYNDQELNPVSIVPETPDEEMYDYFCKLKTNH